jgi:hypothetical protein
MPLKGRHESLRITRFLNTVSYIYVAVVCWREWHYSPGVILLGGVRFPPRVAVEVIPICRVAATSSAVKKDRQPALLGSWGGYLPLHLPVRIRSEWGVTISIGECDSRILEVVVVVVVDRLSFGSGIGVGAVGPGSQGGIGVARG